MIISALYGGYFTDLGNETSLLVSCGKIEANRTSRFPIYKLKLDKLLVKYDDQMNIEDITVVLGAGGPN